MASKPKHDLNSFVPANPDAVLLSPQAAAPVPAVAPASTEPPTRVRFTNTLDPVVWQQLNQYAYWERKDLNQVMEAAMPAFFKDRPEAHRELPEDEKKKRKLI